MKRFDVDCSIADEEFDRLVYEITAQFEAGQSPRLADYQRHHPQLADRLKRLWPTLRAVADLGHFPNPATPRSTASRRGTLGDFEIIREVGRGGMGVVYEAEQISLSRRVALKVLPFAAVLDGTQLQRFKNEAQVAACLSHQNIVPVYAVGCERSVHFYAMQFIEGRTLAELVDENSVATESPGIPAESPTSLHTTNYPQHHDDSFLPNGEEKAKSSTETRAKAGQSTLQSQQPHSKEYFRSVAQLAVQAAGALHHAHQEGVIHRDIKPSNLILDKRGRLWVADFGLAFVNRGQSLTMTGDLVGTLRYMSPEQAAGSRGDIDHRSDIYSLGITIYELLVGRPAFPDHNRHTLLRRIAEREPPTPRSIKNSIPRELETIVLKAISKDPASRFHTMEDFQTDLQRFLDDKPIRARRTPWPIRCLRWCKKNPVTSTLFAVLLVLAGAMAYTLASKSAVVLSRDSSLALRPIATNMDASDVSADGKFLALTDWQSGNLAILDLETGMPRAVTTDGNWELPESEQQYAEGCIWSPNGQLLVYQWIMNNVHQLRVIRKDGTGQRTLLQKTSLRYLQPLSWSADGQNVLVLHQFHDGTQKLLLVNATDGTETVVHTLAEPLATGICLSPSGRFVVYGWYPSGEGLQDVYVLDTESKEVVRVVVHPADDSYPQFTPDGRWIVFLSNRRGAQGVWALRWENDRPLGEPQLIYELDGINRPLRVSQNGSFYFTKKERDRDIYTTELDVDSGAITREVTRLVTRYEGVNSVATYSPSGDRLAWISRVTSSRDAGVLTIRELNSGQTQEIALRHPRLTCTLVGLRWSPDGRSLIVCGPTMRRGTRIEYFRVDIETKKTTEFLADVIAPFTNHFALSKNQRFLYFVESKSKLEDDKGRIVRIDLSNWQQMPLYSPLASDVLRNLALSSDGKQLAFSTGRTLGVVSSDGGQERVIRRLPQSQEFAHQSLAWGRDGNSLLCGLAYLNSESVSLWQFFLDQRKPRPVGITTRGIVGLSVHPNGRQLVFGSSSGRPMPTLWAIDNLTTYLSTLRTVD